MAVELSRNALRLLQLIDAKAEGRTDVEVMPDNQMAAAAGLGYLGSDLYDDAIGQLLTQHVLQEGATNNALLSNTVGSSPYGGAFKITPLGRSLLRPR